MNGTEPTKVEIQHFDLSQKAEKRYQGNSWGETTVGKMSLA